jgi:Zn-dependent hydrolases, including glyoxylases
MYFQQFYLSCLAHASYLIGSEGEAAVIDPRRDVEVYLEEARQQGFRISHVIETHLHADFVSGHRELAERTGATIYLGVSARARFPHRPVSDGDEIRFGRCILRFLETPGHTPESVSVLLTDLDRSPEPYAVFTGDTLFVGDVGRPDLSPDYTPAELAGMLYDSLHTKLLRLPDHVEVYPAHGAGSLCGRQIGAERVSTIGRERITNYALKPMPRDAFIRLLTDNLPDRPEYFAQDVEMNREGASSLAELPPLPALDPPEVERLQREGALVLDVRPPSQFGAGHVPDSVQIGLSGQFASWAGILLGLEKTIVLVAEDSDQANEARLRLARVGVERVAGVLSGGLFAWTESKRPFRQVPQITVHELRQMLSEAEPPQVFDVRRKEEWEAGHLEQAVLAPLQQLAEIVPSFNVARPAAVHCKSGYRSAIACSLLLRSGYKNVLNVIGGIDAWVAAGYPVTAA